MRRCTVVREGAPTTWEPPPTQVKGFLLTAPPIKQLSVKMNWYLLLNQQTLEEGNAILKKEEIYMCIFSWHGFKSCLQLIYNAHRIQFFIWKSNKSFEWVGAC